MLHTILTFCFSGPATAGFARFRALLSKHVGLTESMLFLRTRFGTDFREPSNWRERLTSFETANPGYHGRYHLVRCWLIEFDEEGMPTREIGLDETDLVVVAGPSMMDYGFWMDANMRISDFTGDPVTPEYFEKMWTASGVVAS
jgi:hypothetical protein